MSTRFALVAKQEDRLRFTMTNHHAHVSFLYQRGDKVKIIYPTYRYRDWQQFIVIDFLRDDGQNFYRLFCPKTYQDLWSEENYLISGGNCKF